MDGSEETRELRRHLANGLRAAGVAEGAALLAACSGGADSVAMTLALAELRGRRGFGFPLHIAHVDHGLRAGSAADAAWVEGFAASLDLPVSVTRVDCGGPGNTEAVARAKRHAALGREAQRVGAAAVLTAHTADDQLETLLMRLVRGAGVRGMAGIPGERPMAAGVTLLRPLLGVRRATLRAFLEERGQGFRHDETNDDATRARARLRRDVLPVLHELGPGAGRHASELAEELREVEGALAWAAKHVTFPLERWEARATPAAVVDAALTRELDAAGVPADRRNRGRRAAMVRAMRDGSGEERVFELGPLELRIGSAVARLAATAGAEPRQERLDDAP